MKKKRKGGKPHIQHNPEYNTLHKKYYAPSSPIPAPGPDVHLSNRSRNRHDSIYYCQPTRQILVEPFDLGPVFRPKELAPINHNPSKIPLFQRAAGTPQSFWSAPSKLFWPPNF
ncbi:hypothetical protein MANI_029449 [Metarhizium anisopliae]|nr:hypothetical protein MANI_029449 [Metarhizium anisopliae]